MNVLTLVPGCAFGGVHGNWSCNKKYWLLWGMALFSQGISHTHFMEIMRGCLILPCQKDSILCFLSYVLSGTLVSMNAWLNPLRLLDSCAGNKEINMDFFSDIPPATTAVPQLCNCAYHTSSFCVFAGLFPPFFRSYLRWFLEAFKESHNPVYSPCHETKL